MLKERQAQDTEMRGRETETETERQRQRDRERQRDRDREGGREEGSIRHLSVPGGFSTTGKIIVLS